MPALSATGIQLEALVAALFPVRVGVGVTNPLAAPEGPLFHVEQEAVRNAIPARQREFYAGRLAAGRAQAALGLTPRPVPMAADRSPLWPDGLCGSISHAAGTCIAVACSDPATAALGLDIEKNTPLPDEILETVLNTDELDWINQKPDPGRLASLFFSAKECAFKAQYPLSGQLFGFETIAITADPGAGIFVARFTREVPPFARGARLSGRLLLTDQLIITAMTVPA